MFKSSVQSLNNTWMIYCDNLFGWSCLLSYNFRTFLTIKIQVWALYLLGIPLERYPLAMQGSPVDSIFFVKYIDEIVARTISETLCNFIELLKMVEVCLGHSQNI